MGWNEKVSGFITRCVNDVKRGFASWRRQLSIGGACRRNVHINILLRDDDRFFHVLTCVVTEVDDRNRTVVWATGLFTLERSLGFAGDFDRLGAFSVVVPGDAVSDILRGKPTLSNQ